MCTVPFGRPVDPDEYSQNAMSSGPVAAGASAGSCARKSSNAIASAGNEAFGRETITLRTSCGAFASAASSTGSKGAETSAACARQWPIMYA